MQDSNLNFITKWKKNIYMEINMDKHSAYNLQLGWKTV